MSLARGEHPTSTDWQGSERTVSSLVEMFFPALSLLLASAAAANAAIHDIQVGSSNGTLAFSPEAIPAQPGDQVVFHFQQKNHTATQSSLTSPCQQKQGGFNSGFNPVPANQTSGFPTYTITVNDTQPLWVFCDQAANTPASHCGAGMVFAVNCGPDGSANSFTAFKNAALAIGKQLQANASASTTVASSTAESFTTAAYGDVTIPAAPTPSVVTVTVTVEASVWQTVYSSYPGSPAATPVSLGGTVHKVLVGNNGSLSYSPSFIMAAPRDIITFEFHQKNHTVTMSSFPGPCNAALDATGAPVLTSGFVPVAADVTSDFPTWNVTVNDTTPTWFYCQQHSPDGSSHCGAGMVFAINPVQDSPRNFTAFQNLAIALNGTNATGSLSTNGSAPASQPSQPSSAGILAVNTALSLGSVLALFAMAL